MSRNFTPGTGDIEVAYDMWIQEYETQTWQQSQKEFKRWLEQVKADAWDEGYRAKECDQSRYVYGPVFVPARNPYREQEEA